MRFCYILPERVFPNIAEMEQMKHAAATLTRIMLFGCCLALTGCAGYTGFGYGPGYGPPAHAPANGYRYKYQGHDMVYDSGLGVYVVIGQSSVYY